MSEREESNCCGRTEGEGHAKGCPYRPDSPTPSEPRTVKDAGDCGGSYHFGLCQSCGTYFAVAEAAEPAALDVERLADALEAIWDDKPADQPLYLDDLRMWRVRMAQRILSRLQSPDPR